MVAHPADSALNQICLEYSYAELTKATRYFEVSQRVGKGSFGGVFRGVQEDGTEIAVKVLDVPEGSGFEEEVRVLSKFRHPNLVILMGFARNGSQRLLVYELLEGGDIYHRLRRNDGTKFTARQRVSAAFDAACGLSHLHHASPKVFHRDIKTLNILLDRNGTAKMADFGLACLSHTQSHKVNQMSGTIGYVCPLFLQRGIVTEGAEVYSFGVVLLELLTGTDPAVIVQAANGSQTYQLLVTSINGDRRKAVSIADKRANWPSKLACDVADLAVRVTQGVEELRPKFKEVVNILRPLRDVPDDPCPYTAQQTPNVTNGGDLTQSRAPRHVVPAQQVGAVSQAGRIVGVSQQPGRVANMSSSPGIDRKPEIQTVEIRRLSHDGNAYTSHVPADNDIRRVAKDGMTYASQVSADNDIRRVSQDSITYASQVSADTDSRQTKEGITYTGHASANNDALRPQVQSKIVQAGTYKAGDAPRQCVVQPRANTEAQKPHQEAVVRPMHGVAHAPSGRSDVRSLTSNFDTPCNIVESSHSVQDLGGGAAKSIDQVHRSRTPCRYQVEAQAPGTKVGKIVPASATRVMPQPGQICVSKPSPDAGLQKSSNTYIPCQSVNSPRTEIVRAQMCPPASVQKANADQSKPVEKANLVEDFTSVATTDDACLGTSLVGDTRPLFCLLLGGSSVRDGVDSKCCRIVHGPPLGSDPDREPCPPLLIGRACAPGFWQHVLKEEVLHTMSRQQMQIEPSSRNQLGSIGFRVKNLSDKKPIRVLSNMDDATVPPELGRGEGQDLTHGCIITLSLSKDHSLWLLFQALGGGMPVVKCKTTMG